MSGLPKNVLGVFVSGDSALFTRPDHRRQRLSYPVMPPSAARGLLEQIVFDHAFWWKIHRIDLCSPLLLRSEARQEIHFDDPGKLEEICLRESVIVESPSYVVYAEIARKPGVSDGYWNAKSDGFWHESKRRIERGQAWGTPFFGTREHGVACWRPASAEDVPVAVDIDLTLPIRIFDEVPFDESRPLRHQGGIAGHGELNPLLVPLRVRGGRMPITAQSVKWAL
jgi:CRISPR-associated protein Cas5d